MANTKSTPQSKPAEDLKSGAASQPKAKKTVLETPAAAPAASKKPAPAPLPAEAKAAAVEKPVPPAAVSQEDAAPPARPASRKPKAKSADAPAEPKPLAAAAESAIVGQEPDQTEIDRQIAEAAYYLAEKRNFQPGFEAEDWATATAEVLAKLGLSA